MHLVCQKTPFAIRTYRTPFENIVTVSRNAQRTVAGGCGPAGGPAGGPASGPRGGRFVTPGCRRLSSSRCGSSSCRLSSSRFGPASGPAGGRCMAPGRRRLSSSRCGPAGGRCIAPGRRRICSSRCFRSAKTQGVDKKRDQFVPPSSHTNGTVLSC